MGIYSIFLGVDSVCRCPTWLLSWFFQLGLKLGDNPNLCCFLFFRGGTSNITFGGTVVPDFPTKLSISGPGRSMQCSLSPVRAGASCFVSFFALAKFQIRVGENRWKQIIFKVRIACFQSSPMLQKPFGRKFWRPLGLGSLELPRWSFSEWEGRCLAPHPDASRCQGFPRIEQE